MKKEEIILEVAPCGIDCSRCIALAGGDARRHAAALQEVFGPSFHKFADRFAERVPVFAKYGDFREFVDFLAGIDCAGCRNSPVEEKPCGILKCYRGKGVDFCFECGEFPCEVEIIDDDLKKRWIETGMRIREIGLEAWYAEMKKRHRYE
jgi:hypothetical protein